MKRLAVTYIVAACTGAILTGCVVVPASVEPVYAAPSGVVYVAPTYAAPAVGYAWQYNVRYGWGWRHPGYGWHRGWR